MNAKELREKFAQKQPASVIVDVPNVGRVMVRELTVGDLDSVDRDDTADAQAKNVALSIFTEDGAERVFDPEDRSHLEIIKGLGARSINQIIGAFDEKN